MIVTFPFFFERNVTISVEMEKAYPYYELLLQGVEDFAVKEGLMVVTDETEAMFDLPLGSSPLSPSRSKEAFLKLIRRAQC